MLGRECGLSLLAISPVRGWKLLFDTRCTLSVQQPYSIQLNRLSSKLLEVAWPACPVFCAWEALAAACASWVFAAVSACAAGVAAAFASACGCSNFWLIFGKLREARSQLYRSRFLQGNSNYSFEY